jgi:hypothetical protein
MQARRLYQRSSLTVIGFVCMLVVRMAQATNGDPIARVAPGPPTRDYKRDYNNPVAAVCQLIMPPNLRTESPLPAARRP